jgi:hypothetical protein
MDSRYIVGYKYMFLPISWFLVVNVPCQLANLLVCGTQFMAPLMIHSFPEEGRAL